MTDSTGRNEMQHLDSRKLRAVDLLAEGKTATEVSAEIGIDRSTLWRWGTDPFFRAELARRREEVWNVSIDRLRTLVPRALDVIGVALDQGDWKAAVAVLKFAGISDLRLDAVGSTDPDAIAKGDAMEEEDKVVGELEVEQARAFRRRSVGLS